VAGEPGNSSTNGGTGWGKGGKGKGVKNSRQKNKSKDKKQRKNSKGYEVSKLQAKWPARNHCTTQQFNSRYCRG
jgi:hypothetical protein